MRITNSMMMKNYMRNLNSNMSTVGKYQEQLASGKRVNRLSDDPIGILKIMDTKSKLNKLDLYEKSIGDAASWLLQTETSLREMNETMTDIYTNTVAASTGTVSADSKKATAELIQQLREHIVQIGNATYGSRYIFGGYNTTAMPFQYNGGTLEYDGFDLVTATPAEVGALQSQVIRYSTGVNITTDVSINGVEMMGTGTDNLDYILGQLVDALQTDADSDTIGGFIGVLQSKQDKVLSLLADVGGKSRRLEMMQNSNSDNEINYTDVLSKVMDIDQAEVTMMYKMAEAVYEASLAVGPSVIQPTLLDFLR